MPRSPQLDLICDLLAAKYGQPGQRAAERLTHWLTGSVPLAYPEILERHLAESHAGLLLDAFWQDLPFGTGGRRGRVGYGANRINPTTVAMSVQGHCHSLRAAAPEAAGRAELAVVVANDVRVFNDISGAYSFLEQDHPLLGFSSRAFAKLACEIYAANGIVCYLVEPESDSAVLSTPELSFLIGELAAAGGVNISASHNPPDDNGVKVYDRFGSQPVAPEDQRLLDAMRDVAEIHRMPFARALDQGLVRAVPRDLHERYVATYVDLYGNLAAPRPELTLCYTPLCGCGLTTVGDVLTRLGFPFAVPPDQGPDGTFAVIPFKTANPEVPQSTGPACAFADSIGSGIVLSSDPDADRVGLEVKLPDGSWQHFDGNQIAAILCYFLLLDPEGPRRKGLVIETLVTTRLLGAIVSRSSGSQLIDDLLVGFKYIADALKVLERDGRYRHVRAAPKDLVLAAEESHGVMMVPTIRDKDATPACMYLAALYQRLRTRGETLLDYYVRIIEEVGSFHSASRSITMTGSEGMVRKNRIMTALRTSPPSTCAGEPVRRIIDYWDEQAFGPFTSESERLPRDVVQILTDGFQVAVRPSGTEPKLKFYCQLLPSGAAGIGAARGAALPHALSTAAESVARRVYGELLARIGLSLGEAALLLPDMIDVDGKIEFERQVAPRLHAALSAGRFARLEDLLVWLREQVAALLPGVNLLPGLKAPVAFLCETPIWREGLRDNAVAAELRDWARQ
jgi:phosphoglucomutase